MRKINALFEGFDLMHTLAEKGYDPDDISDDFLDKQFNDLRLAGIKSGVPYNIVEAVATGA